MKFDMFIRDLPSYPSIKSSLRRLTFASILGVGLFSPASSQTCSPTGCKGPNLVTNGNFEQAINDPNNPVYAFTSQMGYVSCPVNHPSELWGNIAIMTNPNLCYNLWSSYDHTYGDGTGYMMLVDFPDSNPDGSTNFMDIWSTKIPVTGGNTYCFGAWYKNMNTNNNVPKPSFRYVVDSTLLGVSSELASNGQWTYFGFTYTVPAGLDSVNLQIENGKWGGSGNDLAIDDIEFREVGAGTEMPVAMDDIEIVPANSLNYPIPILLNDTMNLGALLLTPTVTLTSPLPSSVGSVSFAPDNSLQFTPAAGITDTTVSFMYELCQSADGCCSEAMVTVIINSPLSVEVNDLGIEMDKKTSLLSWNTSQEFGNSHFEIERSVNRIDFLPIGEVKGSGTTDQLNEYKYTDHQVMQLGVSKVYYRLMQVDFDGTASVAGMVELNLPVNNDQFQFIAYPNPVKDGSLKVELYSGVEDRVVVSFTDFSGRVIKEEKISGLIGTQKLELNVDGLASGIYLLSVKNSKEILHEKIVVGK